MPIRTTEVTRGGKRYFLSYISTTKQPAMELAREIRGKGKKEAVCSLIPGQKTNYGVYTREK